MLHSSRLTKKGWIKKKKKKKCETEIGVRRGKKIVKKQTSGESVIPAVVEKGEGERERE